MSGVVRIGDKCSGHDHFKPRTAITGSNDVFINGKGAHCLGDSWEKHCYDSSCHKGTLVSGSKCVFVNGKPLGIVGSKIDCGSIVATGSNNVFAS